MKKIILIACFGVLVMSCSNPSDSDYSDENETTQNEITQKDDSLAWYFVSETVLYDSRYDSMTVGQALIYYGVEDLYNRPYAYKLGWQAIDYSDGNWVLIPTAGLIKEIKSPSVTIRCIYSPDMRATQIKDVVIAYR